MPAILTKKLATVLIALSALLWSGGAATAQTEFQRDIIGIWATKGNRAHIELLACADKICGDMVWIPDPYDDEGALKRDTNNPEPDQRNRPLLGLRMITSFEQTSADTWKKGKIYNANRGKSYSVKLKLKSKNELFVGRCFIKCFGQTWHRLQ